MWWIGKKGTDRNVYHWSVTVLLIFVLGVASYIWFIGVDPPLDVPDVPMILKIPESLKEELNAAVKADAAIIGIQIVTVNFPRNVRMETFASSESKLLQELYTRYIHTKTVETPLFTEDKENNQRTLRLINGEFVCSPFRETLAYRYAPQAEQIVNSVCAIGIPPFHYGEFTGIMAIYLNKPITNDEKNALFHFARDISLRIAERNKIIDGNFK